MKVLGCGEGVRSQSTRDTFVHVLWLGICGCGRL